MAAAKAGPVTFTAAAGVRFHETDVAFTRDRDREQPGGPAVYSFTADGDTVSRVRDLAAAEPQWDIAEVAG